MEIMGACFQDEFGRIGEVGGERVEDGALDSSEDMLSRYDLRMSLSISATLLALSTCKNY